MLEERLALGAAELGIGLDAVALPALRRYYELLVEWNRRFNLTRITDEDEAADKHLIDSLTILRLPSRGEWRRLADIGTGAGFPGIPLKIVVPSLDVTLVEATAKKVAFLEAVISELQLTGIRALHGRGEELGRKAEYRERFDVVTARAVARLNALAEYCLPLVSVGGRFVAYKGPEAGAEVAEGERAIETLGGAVEGIESFELPGASGQRSLIVVRKDSPTPAKYPRPTAQIGKRPL